MNKYIVPICYINNSDNIIFTFGACSREDCEDKIMSYFINVYSIDDAPLNYGAFLALLDEKYDVIIGDIKDIETI